MNAAITCLLFSLFLFSCTTMPRTFNNPSAAAPIGPYSHGVQCSGSLLFLSGQIALRSDGSFLDGNVEQQTAQIFENISSILQSQGATLNHVVKTTVFLTSMADFADMNIRYAAAFGEHRPARSTVEVSKLPKDARVEIEVIACVP
mgnify:CR=1 FL=1